MYTWVYKECTVYTGIQGKQGMHGYTWVYRVYSMYVWVYMGKQGIQGILI